MLAVAGGILIALFVILILVGLWLTIRDAARFVFRRPGAVVALALVLAAGAYAVLALNVGQAAKPAQCVGACLNR